MGIMRVVMKHIWKAKVKKDADRDQKQIPMSGAYYESGIPYERDNNVMHQLNLYYPENYSMEKDGRLPTIIDIHGGGLMYGDKDMNHRYCEYLASKGYCVMGMSYRLLPKTDFQGIVQDIFYSLHWLEHFGPDRGFDLSRVFLTGDSAGGHLTGIVLCIQQSKKLQDIYKVNKVGYDFAAAAICNGVCELQDYFYFSEKLNKELDREMIHMILGKEKHGAAWEEYVNFSQVIKEAQKLPPVLVIGSESDNFYHQTRRLMETLKENNVDFEQFIWKREDGPHLVHVFQISHWEWRESRITNDKMLEFFQKNM